MTTRRRVWVVGLLGVPLLVGGVLWLTRSTVRSQGVPVVQPPAYVSLESAQDSAAVSVRWIDVATAMDKVVTTLTLDPSSARRGVVLGDADHPVLAVVGARSMGRGAASYNSELLRVDLVSGQSQTLATHVTDAATPLVVDAQRVVIQRGEDGPEPSVIEGRIPVRTDALALDLVDVSSGATQTLWKGQGQIAMPVCVLSSHEVVAWHLEGGLARLVAVSLETQQTRTVFTHSSPLARDFSCDRAHDTIVFTTAAPDEPWRIVRVNAQRDTGETVLMQGLDQRAAPRVFDDGTVVYNVTGPGLQSLPKVDAPSGTSSGESVADVVMGVDASERWMAVSRMRANSEAWRFVDRTTQGVFERNVSDRVAVFAGFVPHGAAR